MEVFADTRVVVDYQYPESVTHCPRSPAPGLPRCSSPRPVDQRPGQNRGDPFYSRIPTSTNLHPGPRRALHFRFPAIPVPAQRAGSPSAPAPSYVGSRVEKSSNFEKITPSLEWLFLIRLQVGETFALSCSHIWVFFTTIEMLSDNPKWGGK
jgi:hypothetical protein